MGIADVFPFLKPFQQGGTPEHEPTQPAPAPPLIPYPPPVQYESPPPQSSHHYSGPAAGGSVPGQERHYTGPSQEAYHAVPESAPTNPEPTDQAPGMALSLHSIPVATPTIEMQPWVYDFIGWVSSSTYGVARVDLKRPTPPDYSQYTGGNIFVLQPAPAQQPARGWRARPARPPGVRAELVGNDAIRVKDLHAPYTASGARLKITRHVALGPEGEVPWIDCGVGLNFDMELQKLSPVARIKLRDIAAIKAFPRPVLKVGGEWQLFNTSLALKLHYEVPLVHLRQPFQPPARLLLRLDHVVDTGVKLSPSGIEFDETVMQLGQNTSVRAAGGLQFPRQLPIQGELHEAFKLQLHRLGLKTFW